jgi:hypothetical protein
MQRRQSSSSSFEEQSAKLSQARQEWAKQAEEKQRERMRKTSFRANGSSSTGSSSRPMPQPPRAPTRSSAAAGAPSAPRRPMPTPPVAPFNTAAPAPPPMPTPSVVPSNTAAQAPPLVPSRPLRDSRDTSNDTIPIVSEPSAATPSSPTIEASSESLAPITEETLASTTPTGTELVTPVPQERNRTWYSREAATPPSVISAKALNNQAVDDGKRPWYARTARPVRPGSSIELSPSNTAPLDVPSGPTRTSSSNYDHAPSTHTPTSVPPSPSKEGPTHALESLSRSRPSADQGAPPSFPFQATAPPPYADATSPVQWDVFADLVSTADDALISPADKARLAEIMLHAMQARTPEWEARRREARHK